MKKLLFWILVVVILMSLFKGPFKWILRIIQQGIFLAVAWYTEAYTLERIVITLVVIWLVKKIFK